MPALMTLPTEVVHKICGKLVPNLLCIDSRLPLPYEHRLRQRALCSLTLVSHRVGDVATEHLYKHVVIQSTKQMVCLFRTLHDKPELRARLKYLANLVPLNKPEMQDEIEADIQRYFPLLPAIVTSSSPIYPPELHQLGSPELLSAKPLWTHEIIRHMLIMLPRLKDILTTIRAAKNNLPSAVSGDADKAFFGDTSCFPYVSEKPRKLRIKWEPLKHTSEDEDADILGPVFQLYFTPYIANGCRVTDLRFLNLANVTSYRVDDSSFTGLNAVFGEGALASSENNKHLLSWLAQFKDLHLGLSAIDPQKVGRLLAACPNLKTLTWNPFILLQENGQHLDSSDVELALRQAAGHLEDLYLALFSLHCGPISFRQFRALKALSVGIEVLTNYSRGLKRRSDHPATGSIVEIPLASLLPDSLQRLRLLSTNFRPQSRSQCRGTQTAARLCYRDIMGGYVVHGRQLFPIWVADCLEAFAHSCQAMPNFRSIAVVQPFHGILPVDHVSRVEVGNLKAAFGAAGVQFKTQIITSDPTLWGFSAS